MKNTKNLERKSSADRITCFLPLSYNPLLQAKTRLLLDRGADMHFRDVKCMSVLEHTSRSSCEIKITYEKKKGRCKNMEFEAYDEYEKYRIYCHIFQTY